MKKIFQLLFCIIPFISFSLPYYDFHKPDETFILPTELHEVSGISFISNHEIACIQDEDGIVFIYDLILRSITNKFHFGQPNDYEGICISDSNCFILQSNGDLYYLNLKSKIDQKATIYKTFLPSENNEGLCLDETNSRLLLIGKNLSNNSQYSKTDRPIYSWNIITKELSPNPVHIITSEKIISIKSPSDKKGSKKKIVFRPSALCIHPITHELFILSATNHSILILSNTFEYLSYIELDPNAFNKPEGITFDSFGNLYIANEGQTKKPTLLLFKPKA